MVAIRMRKSELVAQHSHTRKGPCSDKSWENRIHSCRMFSRRSVSCSKAHLSGCEPVLFRTTLISLIFRGLTTGQRCAHPKFMRLVRGAAHMFGVCRHVVRGKKESSQYMLMEGDAGDLHYRRKLADKKVMDGASQVTLPTEGIG